MSHPFEITREVVLPAPQRDVWTALTAEPAAWMFPTGTEIPAGTTPPADSPVTTWDPPKHFVVRTDAPDGTFNALGYLIEARAGGTSGLSYVHSGILPDAWEAQIDAIGPHTDFYLHTLGQYLEHFRGRRATYVGQPSAGITGPSGAGGPEAMGTLRAALGVGNDAAVGDRVQTMLGGAGALQGVLDFVSGQFLGVRSAAGLHRFFGRNHFGGVVCMSEHLFGEGVDAAAREAQLKSWLDGVYA